MPLINNKEDLIKNIETVENYLSTGNDNELQEMVDYIKRGKSFVVYKTDNKQLAFVPSKFIGHLENTLEKHALKKFHGGGTTNNKIGQVLMEYYQPDNKLDKQFIQYCKSLGISPNNNSRKYWKNLITDDISKNGNNFTDFPEGRIVEKRHKFRERKPEVIRIAKQNFKKNNHGKLFCQICNFNFEDKYGELGKDFIEGHHVIPVSEMKIGDTTNPNDIALLCCNCHRMVHKRRPWLSMNDLKKILKK